MDGDEQTQTKTRDPLPSFSPFLSLLTRIVRVEAVLALHTPARFRAPDAARPLVDRGEGKAGGAGGGEGSAIATGSWRRERGTKGVGQMVMW